MWSRFIHEGVCYCATESDIRYIKQLPYCKSGMRFILLDDLIKTGSPSKPFDPNDSWFEMLQSQEKELDDEVSAKASSLDSIYQEFRQAQSAVQKAQELSESLEKQKRLVEQQLQEAMRKQQALLLRSKQAESGLKEVKRKREQLHKQKEDAVRARRIKEEVERMRRLQREAADSAKSAANSAQSSSTNGLQTDSQTNSSTKSQSNPQSNASTNASTNPQTNPQTDLQSNPSANPPSTEDSAAGLAAQSAAAAVSPIVVIRDCISQISRVISNCFAWYIFMASSRPMLMNAISMINLQLTHLNPACVNSVINLVSTVLNSLNSYIQRIDEAVKQGKATNLQQADMMMKRCVALRTTCETVTARLQNILPVYLALVKSSHASTSASALAAQKSVSTFPESSHSASGPRPLGSVDLAVDALGGERGARR